MCVFVPLVAAVENLLSSFSTLSDAFDFQFGAVVLRLKEGLDVSHIQGQGEKDGVPTVGNEAGMNVLHAESGPSCGPAENCRPRSSSPLLSLFLLGLLIECHMILLFFCYLF